MNRNNFWRFIIVVLVLIWAVISFYPPTSRDLIQTFRERAVKTDTNFHAIVQRAVDLQQKIPEKPYENLKEAIGTNDITRYFPFFAVTNSNNQTITILNRLQRDAAGKIRLGIDLQGGTSFVVGMQTNSLPPGADVSGALSEAVEVLRKRVDRFGVAEPIIQTEGSDRILVMLPGLSAAEQEEAMVAIQKPAFLALRMVHPQSDEDIRDGIVQPGYEILKRTERRADGKEYTEVVEVKKTPEMTGSGIKNAQVVRGNLGEPEIQFTLDTEGTKQFAEITRNNVGRRLAIVLDGVLYSAPVIKSPIETGIGTISGSFDQKSAFELAYVLQNPLRAPLTLISSNQVDPTLGKDAIRSGIKASIIGTLLVSAFMLVYYLIAGLVANVALVANIIILIGVMCSIGTTFTLPGIAGIVLTVGMAVDANVLIYERIREESAKGKSLRGAIAAGYSRAFGTIFDSHVTTLISSIILWWLGTGSIRGFGVALTWGVAASLFTALVVTRMIFDFLLDRNWLKSIHMLHIIKATKLDFMKLARPAFAISWCLIFVGIGFGFYRGKSMFGKDFLGGDTSTFAFEQRVPEDKIRAALTAAGVKDALIQYQRDLSNGKQTLRIDTAAEEPKQAGELSTADKVKSAVLSIPEGKFVSRGHEHVGAIVGAEIRKSAIIASLLSLFGILVYVAFRYEFSFAVGAVVAVIHDVLMTIGWYCLAPSHRQFNATTVAAILTIIGFSINDTIVIFDRIREDLKLGVRGTFKEVMNQALNQTLSRTIITSGTVFLATMSLYLFGGGAINDFAFTFLVGIITGTYSSIYIASALVLWWHKGQRPHIGSGPIAVENVAVARG
jgi:protein-export membrane protein, SecD/SecF family/protein-export membrane protein SecF/protein-export membrane protein SecD